MKKYLFFFTFIFLTLGGIANAELIWQDDQAISATWDNSLVYCQYLEEDGITESETIIGYWRLPNASELLASFANQYIISPATQTGFQDDLFYWSSTTSADDPNYAWTATFTNEGDMVYGIADSKIYTSSVRCVRDEDEETPVETPDYYDWLIMNGFGIFACAVVVLSPIIKSLFNNKRIFT